MCVGKRLTAGHRMCVSRRRRSLYGNIGTDTDTGRSAKATCNCRYQSIVIESRTYLARNVACEYEKCEVYARAVRA